MGEGAWRPHPQGFAGNDAMPLVAAGGDPNDDATAGAMAPTPALRACPYLRQVLASFSSTIGRTRLMRIVGDGEVRAHADISYYWWERVRVHVPVITSPQARFQCGERAVMRVPSFEGLREFSTRIGIFFFTAGNMVAGCRTLAPK